MNISRTTGSKQHNDNPRSQRSARDYLDFIIENLEALTGIKNGEKYKKAAIQLHVQRHDYTNKQLSYIDVIYEKTMKGLGYPSFQVTYRPKRNFL